MSSVMKAAMVDNQYVKVGNFIKIGDNFYVVTRILKTFIEVANPEGGTFKIPASDSPAKMVEGLLKQLGVSFKEYLGRTTYVVGERMRRLPSTSVAANLTVTPIKDKLLLGDIIIVSNIFSTMFLTVFRTLANYCEGVAATGTTFRYTMSNGNIIPYARSHYYRDQSEYHGYRILGIKQDNLVA